MTVANDVPGRVDQASTRSRAPRGSRVLGAVLLLVGVFLLWTAYDSADGDLGVRGPWLAPGVVTGAWVVLAAWYLVGAFLPTGASVPPSAPTGAVPTDRADGGDSAAAATSAAPTASAALAASPASTTSTTSPASAASTASAGEAGPAPVADDGDEPVVQIRWLTPALLAASLIGYVMLLEPAGFVLASAVFFIAAARVLGSRRWVRDVVVAVPLAVVVYLGFTRGLAIALPPGVLPL
ncbi:tripartite tricarboxylate transporter TctB family protein [Plantactinospora sonchi]|uniref:Tripartite tricarboxylate transporter TctB family protein n=1 Tax=Plantactinospora sonchi TaxID=1544735 RepID=A0ABU7RMC8_9ACTN